MGVYKTLRIAKEKRKRQKGHAHDINAIFTITKIINPLA